MEVLDWVRHEALKETETMVVLARLLDAEARARTGLAFMQQAPGRREDVLRALLIRSERNGRRSQSAC